MNRSSIIAVTVYVIIGSIQKIAASELSQNELCISALLPSDCESNDKLTYGELKISKKPISLTLPFNFMKRGGIATLFQNIGLLMEINGHNVTLFHHKAMVRSDQVETNLNSYVFKTPTTAIKEFLKCNLANLNPLNHLKTETSEKWIIDVHGRSCNHPLLRSNSKRVIIDSISAKETLVSGIWRYLSKIGLPEKVHSQISSYIQWFIGKFDQQKEYDLAFEVSKFNFRRYLARIESGKVKINILAPFFAWKKENAKLPAIKQNDQLMRFVTLSRYYPTKRIDDTIEAFELLITYNSRRNLKFHLDIIGMTNLEIEVEYEKKLRKMINDKNLTEIISIHHHNSENDDLIQDLLKNSDALIHSAVAEPRAIVIFDSLLKGKPVIAYDAGGNRETVIDGLNGLLASPLTTQALAEKIILFMEDEELRRNLTSLASQSMIETYTQQHFYDSFMDYFIN